MKGKICKMVVSPAMMVGLEMVVLTERHEAKLKVAGLQMMGFSLGVTSMDRITN